ncbi:MAG TPA: GH116 family glycosyl-hydrolase [Verrucomicrobiae bacterium]|jgi:uncharacterized protein (DUF608 family)|nr:GH116 family glycosyl-hydrolase [Verrucomicrobiae bacterium]
MKHEPSRWLRLALLVGAASCARGAADAPLIPDEVPPLEWVQFSTPSYSAPVSGMVFDDQHPTCCGLALGGIATGCLDLDVDGTIGFDTLWQGYPKKLQRKTPFLGMAIGDKSWVLAAPAIIRGGIQEGCYEPGRDPYTGPRKWNIATPAIAGVKSASSIRYFGHYPAVNYQYKTEAPVTVSLRSWSPFIPGDVAASSIPAIVFEIHLQNTSDARQKGALALNYPGVQPSDAKNTRWADAGQKGDVLLKAGAPPFDGKMLPETQPAFTRPNPGSVPGGKMVIADLSQTGRPELLLAVRDRATDRGFLISMRRTAETFGKPMNGAGKYEYEIIDAIAHDGFSAVAAGSLTSHEQRIVAGTESGKVYSYRLKTPGYHPASVEPLAFYDRVCLNPAQTDGGHISEIRLAPLYGAGNEVIYSVGYKSPHSDTKPGVYVIDEQGPFPVSTDSQSEYLGCAAGDFLGDGATEVAVASKSSIAEKNWVKMFRLTGHGQVTSEETVLSLDANEGPQWLAAGDFNGDGTNDLLAGTLRRGVLWTQRLKNSSRLEHAWSEPEVASAEDFVAYSDPVKAFKNDPRTYLAVGGQNTMMLGRRDGPDVPPGQSKTWAMQRYYLGPHQGLQDAALPAVALGNLSGADAADVLTWNSQGELTGVTEEGGKFFDVPLPRALRRQTTAKPMSTVVSLPFNEQYALSFLDGQTGRFGGDLGKSPHGWADIQKELPAADASDTGASAAIDFDLAPGESRVYRVALSWFAPQWRSTFTYTRMNLGRYRDVTDIASFMNAHHAELWTRIEAWQRVVDQEKDFPIWLKDALINSLALITVDSYWAAAQPPLGNWCFPGGLYAMIESPRAAPQTECIPCTWYGNIPVVYFFPELMHSTLRGFKEYQRTNDGAMAFNFAPRDEMWWTGDHALENQIALNGFCFVDLVNRQWLRTGEDAIVHEFYPAVKAATQFAINCRPQAFGLMHMPQYGSATEWWEGWQWEGLTTHAGSLNLAGALIAEKMAEKEGDHDFAQQCAQWVHQGEQILERDMWNGQTYLLFKNPKTGRIADDIMANQFDAQWVSFYGAVPPVFNSDHFATGLNSVRTSCIVDTGLSAFASKAGKPYLKAYGNFTPEAFILGMTYMYAGDPETGLDLCRRTLDNIYKKQRYAFDWPNEIDCETGKRSYGTDYYQNMIVWAIPAALHRQTLAMAVAKGSLVDRVIEAGARPSRISKELQTVKPAGTHDNLVPDYIPPTTGDVKPLPAKTN